LGKLPEQSEAAIRMADNTMPKKKEKYWSTTIDYSERDINHGQDDS
jgi:hypothetical protein